MTSKTYVNTPALSRVETQAAVSVNPKALVDFPARNSASRIRMAYLISQYPAVSHTFIFREIACLRKLGLAPEVSSINLPDRAPEKLPADEKQESERVFYIKSEPLYKVAAAHLRTLLTNPRGYLLGIGTALSNAANSGWKNSFSWLFYFAEAVVVGDWMRRRRVGHLHVHFGSAVASVGMLTAKIFKVGFSLTIHGPDEFYDVTRYSLVRKIHAAEFVCCIGNFTRSQLMRMAPTSEWSKFEVARLGVDVDCYPPVPFRSSPRTIELLCVGRLVCSKGQHVLLSAVQLLVSSGYSIRLRLVGDGPDRKTLEAFVRASDLSGSISFEGAVDQQAVRGYLETSDIFVLPSFAEGIPVALMEAMAACIPCVSTRITGIPELIDSGVSGLLVAPSSEEELAGAIASLIDDPEYRRRLGLGGREAVLKSYQLLPNVETLLNIFEQKIKCMREF